MSPIQSASWRALALLGAAGAMACGDARPTAPDAASQHRTLSLTSADGTALADALADARSRITPALGTDAAANHLDAALGHVSDAMTADDRGAFESALAEGDAAVRALAGHSGDPATPQDLDVVRLLFMQGRALLTAPAEGLLRRSASVPPAESPR